jgi:serine/threonine-protein kinase HipA
MHMAQACGITTARHGLVRFKSGELAYLAKRFDRTLKRRKVDKIHQEDMCQLTGLLTEDKYNSSMEKVAQATIQFTTNKGLELVTLFQRTIFCYLTGNSDMHLKNFSLFKNSEGLVQLTPAYDLLATKIVTPEDKEELALPLNGKKNKLNKNDFLAFTKYCNIPDKAARTTIGNFEKNLPTMKSWIAKSFLAEDTKKRYLGLIRERSSVLEL